MKIITVIENNGGERRMFSKGEEPMALDEFDRIPCGSCGEPRKITDIYCSECGARNEGLDEDAFRKTYARSPDETRRYYCDDGVYHLALVRAVALLGDADIYFCNFCGRQII